MAFFKLTTAVSIVCQNVGKFATFDIHCKTCVVLIKQNWEKLRILGLSKKKTIEKYEN